MICKNCGNEMKDDDIFCSKCGFNNTNNNQTPQNEINQNNEIETTNVEHNVLNNAEEQAQSNQNEFVVDSNNNTINTNAVNNANNDFLSTQLNKPITKQDVNTKSYNGQAIASLVLGIISLFFGIIFFISFPSAIAGIILSNKSKKISNSGMGTAGLILSIIGLVISSLILIIIIVILIIKAIYAPEMYL